MTNRVPDPVITPEMWAESQARQRAETERSPQFAAMSKAAEHTKGELDLIAAAEAVVAEAEAELNAAGVAVSRAERGMAPITPDSKRSFSLFERKPETYKAAKASLPGLKTDLQEAHMKAQNARRRLNATVAAINRDRFARRTAAKVAHAPKREAVTSHGDPWASPTAFDRFAGEDAA